MVDMANKLNLMDEFVIEMKEKIIAKSIKHQNTKDLHISNLMPHFIDEIIELCNITDRNDRKVIFRILFDSWASLKKNELKDVANMCWIMNVALENDGWIKGE